MIDRPWQVVRGSETFAFLILCSNFYETNFPCLFIKCLFSSSRMLDAVPAAGEERWCRERGPCPCHGACVAAGGHRGLRARGIHGAPRCVLSWLPPSIASPAACVLAAVNYHPASFYIDCPQHSAVFAANTWTLHPSFIYFLTTSWYHFPYKLPASLLLH